MSRLRVTNLRARLVHLLRTLQSAVVGDPRALRSERQWQQIRAEQIHLLFEQLPSALIASAIVGGLVAFVLWEHVAAGWLAAWLLALSAATLARIWLRRNYLTSKPKPAAAGRWGHLFILGVVVSGLIWGVAGVFPLRGQTLLHEIFLAFVLAGLSAGSMSTLSSFRGAYAAFIIPAIAPFTVKVLRWEGEMFFAMGSMLVLFIVMMSLISARHYRSVTESLRLRFHNLNLLEDLATAHARQQAINQQLEKQMQERRRTEEALAASNQVYRTLVETTGTGYHITDADGRILDANAVYVGLTGHRTLAEILGKQVTEWTASYDVERNAAELKACLARGYVRNLELDYVDGDGKVTPVEINASAVVTDGAPRFICLSRDISGRKQAERALRRAYDDSERKVHERTAELAHANHVLQSEKELFRVTLASIGDAVIATDESARITSLNAVAQRLTGWGEEQAKGRSLSEVLRVLDEETREPAADPVARCLEGSGNTGGGKRAVLVSHDRREINIDMSLAPIRDGEGRNIGVVVVFRDVTEERKLAQHLSHQATHDRLTGLVNRHEFERRLAHVLSSANPFVPHAFVYLDLDQFKVVNDTCGHAAGDDLLRQISALLRTKLRARDTLARLGGDEFGVLLEHCSVPEATRIAHSLRQLIQGYRFGWQDKSFTIGVSIGLVSISRAGETLASVFSAADSACYAAKEKGRNRVHVYQPDDRLLAQRDGEMRWMPRIQQALADGRFRLYYQPIVAFRANAGTGHHGEILIRMLDEAGRLVLPNAFIPAAERYGLMLAIDRWVVKACLETLSAKQDQEPNVVAINVSGQSLGSAEFLDFVNDQIDAIGIAPGTLCFEVTETSAVSELTHALRFIDRLKARGCCFALDDFGAGLSSFGYLKSLPVDYLKIDGAFVRGLAADDVDQAMVEAVNRIGHIMGLKTIAKWVENDAVLLKLRQMGVDYGQGYALGHPQPFVVH